MWKLFKKELFGNFVNLKFLKNSVIAYQSRHSSNENIKRNFNQNMGMISSIRKKYNKVRNNVFTAKLLYFNVFSSATLMMIGDIISQRIEHRNSNLNYDWRRIGRMYVVGMILGPFLHYFYKILDTKIPTVSLSSILQKIFFDEVIMSPIYITIFFYATCFLEDLTFQRVTNEIRSHFLAIYKVDLCTMPFLQLFNFYFINPKYRVLFASGANTLLNAFLCYTKHKDPKEY